MNATKTRLTIMLIGAETNGLVPQADRLIREVFPDAKPAAFKSLEHANRTAKKQVWFPQLIVICQAWSQEYTAAEIHELMANWPLCRLVIAYGPWCDSDGRNFSHWPHAARVPFAQLTNRLEIEKRVLSGEADAMPRTAGRDETFFFNAQRETADGTSIKARIDIADAALRTTVRSVLAAAGIKIVRGSKMAHVSVQDGDVPRRRSASAPSAAGEVRLLAIPDPEKSHGPRVQIVSKPFANAELVDAVLQAAAAPVVS